jgi:hypothetical protein
MYAVYSPCPRCAVQHTMRLPDDRMLCLNCLLRRRRAGAGDPLGRTAATSSATRAEYRPRPAA